jgi:hypothetical protein
MTRISAASICCADSAIMQEERSGTRDSSLCLYLIIATLWLATRPYVGVIHDSRFYTVQALSALLPGRFADDLYFRYGSQDQFTLFTLAYKPMLAVLGLSKAALILAIIGQCFWIACLVYFVRGVLRDGRMALIAVIMVVVLPSGPFLNYGEQFLTPRLFAEALTLLALGSMLRGRPFPALLLLGLSATIHPLMTLPGFAVLFVYQAAGRRIWWALGALPIIAALGLATWGIQPFARLFQTFDPAWFAVVRVRDFFCLLTEWTAFQWLKICYLFGLATLGLAVADPTERRFIVAVLAVALGGLVLTMVGGDLLRNVLVVDAQQYRATWLLAVTANLFVAPLIFRIGWSCASSLTRVALAFAVAMLIVTTFVPMGYLIAMPIMACTGLLTIWERGRNRPIHAVPNMFGLIIVGLGGGITLCLLYSYLVSIEVWPSLFWQTARGIGLTVAALAAAAIYLSADGRVAVGRPLTVFSAGLVAIAAFGWYQRTPWTTFIETADIAPASLSALLPAQGSVYWEGDVRVPWFVLKRASYFSCPQGTGALFFRGTAISYGHRYEIFKPLQTLDFGEARSCPLAERPEDASYNREELVSICKEEPELGAMVLTRPVLNAPGREWISPVEFEDFRPIDGRLRVFTTDRFYVYSCADLRSLRG